MNEQAELPLEYATPIMGVADQMIHCLENLKKFELDIRAALRYGSDSHSFDDIVLLVMAQRVHFYPLETSFIIMEIQRYPNFNTYHGFLAGGKYEEIMAFQPKMLEYAKSFGCKYLSIAGRKGWERVMPRYGWKHQLSIMYREVD